MKCSQCRFYMRSKVYGNGCTCTGLKPCEVARKNKEHKRKIRKHYKLDFSKNEVCYDKI